MKCVIFLDFDGVMDTESYDSYLVNHNMPNVDEYGPIFDPKCVKTLENILNATGAQIVVSSTWKECMTIEEIREMWKKRKLPGYILDVTPNVNPHFRGDEINAWLERQKEEYLYAIIDDLDASQFTEEQLAFLAQTSPWCGMDEDTDDRVFDIMRREIIEMEDVSVVKELVDKGNIAAMIHLSDFYYYGHNVKQSHRKYRQLLYMAAEKGEEFAWLCLAESYRRGDGCKPSMKKYVELMQKAIDAYPQWASEFEEIKKEVMKE